MLDVKTLNDFRSKANHAHKQFCLWMWANNKFANYQNDWDKITESPKLYKIEGLLQNKEYKYTFFWNEVVFSLLCSWILSLARLFDPAHGPKNDIRLSLYYILELFNDISFTSPLLSKFKKYQKTITSVKNVRDNFLVHNDVNLKPRAIAAGVEKLFEELDNFISEVKQRKKHLSNCGNINFKDNELLSHRSIDEIFNALSRC
jgi:hypothetical protein